MLPSIPDSSKSEAIYESTPILTDLGEPVRHTVSRCDGVSGPFPKSNSNGANIGGTESQALTDEKDDQVSGHYADAPPSLAANEWEETAPGDIYTNVGQDLTGESPDNYAQINGSDVTYATQPDRMNATSESNANDCVPEALVNNYTESEDTAFYQVITQSPGNDYVRADFNLK